MRKFMINKIKNMLFYNFQELVTFQTVFKVTSFLIFVPLFLNFFNIIMKVTGYEYLTFENLFSFASNPIVIIMLILLVLFMMVYTFFDLSTIIIILDASYPFFKYRNCFWIYFFNKYTRFHYGLH